MTAQTYNMSSDLRLKNSITDLSNKDEIIDKLDKLEVKQFYWNTDTEKSRQYTGFIA
jgi:hypothetical protein